MIGYHGGNNKSAQHFSIFVGLPESGEMKAGRLEGMDDMDVTGDVATEVAHGSNAEDSHASADPRSTDISPASDDVSPASADVISVAATDIIPVSAADIISASSVKVACTINDDVAHNSSISQIPSSIPTRLFVGNIPLHTCPNPTGEDKIAHAFNNSTRKTLSYVAPTIQNGEVVVKPTLNTIRNGSTRWKTTAVGYFLGKRPCFHHVKEYALSVWPSLRETVAYMEEVIEGEPWLFKGQHIVLQKWELGMVMRKLNHTQVPTEEGLSIVASGIGKPLYPDAITRACTRLDFARWLPPKCTSCMTLGHSAKDCTLKKSSKPVRTPVSVYMPKTGPPRPPPMPDRDMPPHPPPREVEKQRKGRESPIVVAGPSREERGKAIIIYNTFDALHQQPDTDESIRGPKQTIWNVRGLNKRDHQLAVKDIIAEFRLQFLGLLETRICINNLSHIQAFLLPQWKWFVDYGSSGNRIWIAWDGNFIDVDVVECGTQFIHCHINIRALHESIAITVIYGANEMVERREVWGSMETIAMQCIDIPWLVGGDFNAVRDLSEICGVSGDIRMAMEDFNTCIQNTGLLSLPMQGEWYTWHNCSAGPRNLWKRLDRMLINDRWIARFPTSYYCCLTPRTSDHSPMVLCGDRQQQLGGMFRFDNYLALSPEFILSVQQVWQHHIIGVPMYAVTRKLKALKPMFREQRRNKGDLSHNVQLAKGFLEMAQLLVSSNRRDELFLQLEHCCRLVLAKAAKLEQ
ncbi:UNVERIFIED_CONTAM: hypothetical protein Sindi_1300000, partial [Sesamum indicum]